MESTITIRPFEAGDVDSVLALEQECQELAHWSRRDYQDVLHGAMEGWIAAHEETVAGFVVIRRIHHEVEILNLAVARDERRKGIGTKLLETALENAAKQGVLGTFLEVRMSNDAALSLYRRHGFRVVGRRLGYYHSPNEDALTLATEFGASNALGSPNEAR
jgi:ribosomal-protein-alanine N-acetyltransferase